MSDEADVEDDAGPHHGALVDLPGTEYDGIGRSGDREHEGTGGRDGQGEDQHGGLNVVHAEGDVVEHRNKKEGGGSVGGEFGQENDEKDDRSHDEEKGPALGEIVEMIGEEGTGTREGEDLAQGQSAAEEDDHAPVGGTIDVLPADEAESGEEDEGCRWR